ncbi:MAG: hypothetical protein K0Q97_1262 [Bacillota bacterium]|jgi:hypothetical protein|nr:hypothetical protein [Bacillota bacterium]
MEIKKKIYVLYKIHKYFTKKIDFKKYFLYNKIKTKKLVKLDIRGCLTNDRII